MGNPRITDELSEYPYDSEKATESIEVELTEDTFNYLARMAHERDITFNHLVCAMIDRDIRERERAKSESGDDGVVD